MCKLCVSFAEIISENLWCLSGLSGLVTENGKKTKQNTALRWFILQQLFDFIAVIYSSFSFLKNTNLCPPSFYDCYAVVYGIIYMDVALRKLYCRLSITVDPRPGGGGFHQERCKCSLELVICYIDGALKASHRSAIDV